MAAIIAPTVGGAFPVKEVHASGTTLFRVAADELGDATQWNRIAAINAPALLNADGFIDPWVYAPTRLAIPAAGVSNGGILGA